MSDPIGWLKGKSAHLSVTLAARFLAREIYQALFERQAQPDELSSCAEAIKADGSIAPVLKTQLISSEFQQKCFAAVAPEVAEAAYQGILGRKGDPAGLKSYTEQLIKHRNLADLLASMIQCPEFKAKYDAGIIANFLGSVWAQPPDLVHIEAPPEQFEHLFNRIRDQWIKLGETEPHWSVVTQEKFRSKNFSKYEQEFYNSGVDTFSTIERTTQRAGLQINPAATVLELGCGTGRVTHVLADQFAHVIAVDVSPGNLHLCEKKLRQLGKTNVEYVLLKSPRDIENIPPIDFFFSTIVLQHNPPPVIYYFLDQILGKVRESGTVFFQVPTHIAGYSFDVTRYLASPEPPMETHCLPMRAVFSLFEKHALAPLEVLMDNSTGQPGSHTFFAVRR